MKTPKKYIIFILFYLMIFQFKNAKVYALSENTGHLQLRTIQKNVEILINQKVVATIKPPQIYELNQKTPNETIEVPLYSDNIPNFTVKATSPSEIIYKNKPNDNSLKLSFDGSKSSYYIFSPQINMPNNSCFIKLIFYYTASNGNLLKSKKDNIMVNINYYDQNKDFLFNQNQNIIINPTNEKKECEISFVPLRSFKYLTFVISQTNTKLVSISYSNFKIIQYSYNIVPFELTHEQKTDKSIYQEYSNEYQKVERKISLASNKDIANVEETIIPLKNHQVFKEQTSVEVYSQTEKILKRDYSLEKPIHSLYTIDSLSNFYLETKKISMGYANNFDSIEVINSHNNTLIDLYHVNSEDIKYFVFEKNGKKNWVFNQLIQKDHNKTVSYSFLLNQNLYAIKSRTPKFNKAIMIITNHSDSNMVDLLSAMMFGTSDKQDSLYGKSGFIGYKIPATWGFFYKSANGIDGFDNQQYRNIIDIMRKNGIETVLHSASPIAKENTPQLIKKALNDISYLNIDNWIDHSLVDGTRCADLKSEGANKNSSNYSFDIFLEMGYKYSWSYLDTISEDLNMLMPSFEYFHPQIIFKNYNFGEGNSLYQWNSVRYKNLLDQVNKNSLEKLIQQNGICIIHDYFTHPMQKNKFFYSKNKQVYLTDDFDNFLKLIDFYRNQNLLWITTIKEFGDFEEALRNIFITPESQHSLLILNNNSFSLNNFSLIIFNHSHEIRKVIHLKPGKNIININNLFN